jgi:hypothetical protein
MQFTVQHSTLERSSEGNVPRAERHVANLKREKGLGNLERIVALGLLPLLFDHTQSSRPQLARHPSPPSLRHSPPGPLRIYVMMVALPDELCSTIFQHCRQAQDQAVPTLGGGFWIPQTTLASVMRVSTVSKPTSVRHWPCKQGARRWDMADTIQRFHTLAAPILYDQVSVINMCSFLYGIPDERAPPSPMDPSGLGAAQAA